VTDHRTLAAENVLNSYDLDADEVDAIVARWNEYAFEDTPQGWSLAISKLNSIAYEHVIRRAGEWASYQAQHLRRETKQ